MLIRMRSEVFVAKTNRTLEAGKVYDIDAEEAQAMVDAGLAEEER